MASYHCEDLTDENKNDWDTFNNQCQRGSIYHTLSWKKVLELSFGYKSRYFLIYDGGKPVALCPCFEVPLRGLKSLIPPPESDLKHLVISESPDRSVVDLIINKLIEIAKNDKCSFILTTDSDVSIIDSIRDDCHKEHLKTYPFQTSGYFSLDLQKYDPKFIWNSLFTGKSRQRSYIKRFEQEGFTIRATREQRDIEKFYTYYAQNINLIGARPYEKSHFNILFNQYPENEMRMTLLEKDNFFAGGLLALLFPQKGTMYLRYLALNREMPWAYRPPLALDWEAVNYAYANNFKEVCFGTNTKNEEDRNYRIKKEFGCQYHDYYSELIPVSHFSRFVYYIYRQYNNIKDRRKKNREKTTQAIEKKEI